MIKFNKKLVSGSLVLLILINSYHLLNFIFQWSMARMLSLEQYAELATLISLVYLMSAFSESIQIVTAKYSAFLKKPGVIHTLLNKTLKKTLVISSIVFVLYLILSIFLSPLLKIDYPLLAINGLLIFSLFLAPVTRGTLQGMKRFGAFGGNLVIEGLVKTILAVFFVYLGFQVYGAVAAIVLSVSISFAFSFIHLKDIRKSKPQKLVTKNLYSYSLPVLLVNFIVLAISSFDILIAKVVFDPSTAGAYALASVIGKIVFLGTMPISKAMFPLSAESNDKNNHRKNLLLSASLILIGIVAICLIIFHSMPDLLIKIFAGKAVPEASNILFVVGGAFGMISLANLLLSYTLSKGIFNKAWILSIWLIIEISLLYIYSGSIVSFSLAFLASATLFLIGSIVLTRYT